MAGRDEGDVVATLPLKRQHHPGKFLGAHLLPLPLPAYLPVLAVDAAQVAPREEDRPRAPTAAQAILLAVMRPVGVDDGARAGAAHGAAQRVLAVDTAVARAQVA